MNDGTIARDLSRAASSRYDLLVVGGGIHGAALALEAARRGIATLLVERGDFGGETSANSLRIVHGGLRYLQALDLARFRDSVAERRFWLAHFPDLVRPLPCLMPLHAPPRGGALRRPAALRLALAANDLLSRRRNRGVSADRAIPDGRLLGPAETAELFPAVDRRGLVGGALWHDAAAADSERLLIEVLRWACRCGAAALNYVEAEALLTDDRGRVAGIVARDRVTGEAVRLSARRVVNCAGPWCRPLAARFDRDLPALFAPTLAFNVLLDREPPSPAALAAAAPRRGAQTWFLHPWRGKVLAGTRYLAPGAGEPAAGPGEAEVRAFLAELDQALPGLVLSGAAVLAVPWGLQPARRAGAAEPATRPVVHDHGAHGGPRGLVTVSGVKLTTARLVAEQALAALYGARLPARAATGRPPASRPLPFADFARLLEEDPYAAAAHLRRLMRRESVVRLEDLLLRRTDWGEDPRAAGLAGRIAELMREPAGVRLRPREGARLAAR